MISFNRSVASLIVNFPAGYDHTMAFIFPNGVVLFSPKRYPLMYRKQCRLALLTKGMDDISIM